MDKSSKENTDMKDQWICDMTTTTNFIRHYRPHTESLAAVLFDQSEAET